MKLRYFKQGERLIYQASWYRISHLRCSVRKGVLKNFARFTGKYLSQGLCNFIKIEALAQVFSCEFCKISKNTFFIEHVWATASLDIFVDKILNVLTQKNIKAIEATESIYSRSLYLSQNLNVNYKIFTFQVNCQSFPRIKNTENPDCFWFQKGLCYIASVWVINHG